ncbi:MAG: hypothetical protein QNJ47_18575 [Nostocaceae cyanobacterium]|nr:hypothetical protein [Nostocaceae cyanobacterium]
MFNGVIPALEKEQLNQTALNINSIKQVLESYLTSNSLEDEVDEFFREVAALRGKSVDDTLLEMRTGSQKYIEAVNTPVEFKNDIPVDVNKYSEQLQKLSEGIENCWDFFSQESQQFLINSASGFLEAYSKFQGWKSLIIRAKLFLPSIQTKQNLYKKYKESFFLIPKAVERATDIRKLKSTSQLQATAQSLLQRVKNINQQKLSTYLTHLGKDREEQIEKNKPAMAWAKARLEKMKNQQNQNEQN